MRQTEQARWRATDGSACVWTTDRRVWLRVGPCGEYRELGMSPTAKAAIIRVRRRHPGQHWQRMGCGTTTRVDDGPKDRHRWKREDRVPEPLPPHPAREMSLIRLARIAAYAVRWQDGVMPAVAPLTLGEIVAALTRPDIGAILRGPTSYIEPVPAEDLAAALALYLMPVSVTEDDEDDWEDAA